MHVLVTGATGNVGWAVMSQLLGDPRITRVTGVARRPPPDPPAGTHWIAADVGVSSLRPMMEGVDAVIHLAWAIQPSRDRAATRRTNVLGSARVAQAAADVGVPALIHASSVGVYSPGPKDRAVDESWPREGVRTSFYARDKVEAERGLDRVARVHPNTRIVRMRPGLIFSRQAATGVRRLFLGPAVPRALLRPSRIPVVPDIAGLRFQALHTRDAARAYLEAVVRDVEGAFNIAADPVLEPRVLAAALGARMVRVPPRLVRGAMAATWRAGIQPTPEGWLDLALGVPLMDCSRAHRQLEWEPTVPSTEAVLELLTGMADGAGAPTPPLAPVAGGAEEDSGMVRAGWLSGLGRSG
ncbi:MAG: NAD-dependent epimerase/dehydratase family protein [Thermoleophilia bacterium]